VLLVVSDKAAALMSGTRAQPLPFARGMTELLGLAAQWLLGRPSVYAIPAALPFLRLGETIYHPASAARGLSDVAAGTLAITWPLGEREADVRRAQAARLLASLRPGLAAIPIAAGATPGYLRLPVLASAPARAAAGTEEARRLGVGVGYPQALCDLAGFDRVMNGGEPFPGARTLAQRLVTLPVHGLLSDADLAALETWIGTIRE
jgi:hypothetical protein